MYFLFAEAQASQMSPGYKYYDMRHYLFNEYLALVYVPPLKIKHERMDK